MQWCTKKRQVAKMKKSTKMLGFMFRFDCWYSRQKEGPRLIILFLIVSPLILVNVLMMLQLFCDFTSLTLLIVALVGIACTGCITVSRLNYMIYRIENKEL